MQKKRSEEVNRLHEEIVDLKTQIRELEILLAEQNPSEIFEKEKDKK